MIMMGPYFVGANAHRIRSLRTEKDPITLSVPTYGSYRVAYATNAPFYVNDKHIAKAILARQESMAQAFHISYWKCGPVGNKQDDDGIQHIRLEFRSSEQRDLFLADGGFEAHGETIRLDVIPAERYELAPKETIKEETKEPQESKRVQLKKTRQY